MKQVFKISIVDAYYFVLTSENKERGYDVPLSNGLDAGIWFWSFCCEAQQYCIALEFLELDFVILIGRKKWLQEISP